MKQGRAVKKRNLVRKTDPDVEPVIDDILVEFDGDSSSRGFESLPHPAYNYAPANFYDDNGQRVRVRVSGSSVYDFEGGHHLNTAFKVLTVIRRGKAAGIFSTTSVMVYLWLMEHVYTENIVTGFTLAQVGSELGKIHTPDVSHAITQLENRLLLLRNGRGCILLNPRYCFFGPSQRQNEVCKEWDKLVAERKQEIQRRRKKVGKVSMLVPA